MLLSAPMLNSKMTNVPYCVLEINKAHTCLCAHRSYTCFFQKAEKRPWQPNLVRLCNTLKPCCTSALKFPLTSRFAGISRCVTYCNKHLGSKCLCLAISLILHGLLQTLLFNGKAMLDPLSLADCKGISCGGQNLITVQVLVLFVALLVATVCMSLHMWAMQVSN